MLHNAAVQNTPRHAWDGTAATIVNISNHTNFCFVFEMVAALAADATFRFVAYNADAALLPPRLSGRP